MTKGFIRTLLAFILLIGSSFTLTACDSCSMKLSNSQLSLYEFSCNLINQYSNESGNTISQHIGSGTPLLCKKDVAAEELNDRIVISDIRANSITGPLYYSILFSAKTQGKSNKTFSIAATIAFKIKSNSNNNALTEYIYCTTHDSLATKGIAACKDYIYSSKIAYTADSITKLLRNPDDPDSDYSKSGNDHGSSKITAQSFDFTNNYIEPVSCTFNGKTVGETGIISASVDTSSNDTYTTTESNLVSFCEDAVEYLFQSKSVSGYPYTYSGVTTQLLNIFGLIADDTTAEKFGQYHYFAEVDTGWITSNASETSFAEVAANQTSNINESTIGLCQFTPKKQESGFTMSGGNRQVAFARVLEGETYKWYVVGNIDTATKSYDPGKAFTNVADPEIWNVEKGFKTDAGNLIDLSDEGRCPGTSCPVSFDPGS